MRTKSGCLCFVLLVFGFLVAPRARAFVAPGFVAAWGGEGSGPGQLEYPYGVAVAADGSFYVTDQYNFRIVHFSSSGSVIESWGSFGNRSGQFGITIGIVVDATGRVFVADYGNDRVQVFDAHGAYIRQWGGRGPGPGQFRGPMDVAVDPQGNVLVLESGNQRIQVFTPDGVFLSSWNIEQPTGLCVDSFGNIYVVGFETGFGQNVTKWSPSHARLGIWHGDPGNPDSYPGGMGGIAVDAAGELYVTDHLKNRIMTVGPNLGLLGIWGAPGAAPGQFDHPVDVAIGPDGSLFVVDMYNHRIEKFSYFVVPARTVSWGAVKAAFR